MIPTIITMWAETGHTVADLSPLEVVRHHQARDLLPADYHLLSEEQAIAVYHAGMSWWVWGWLADDVREAVTSYMRASVRAVGRVGQ